MGSSDLLVGEKGHFRIRNIDLSLSKKREIIQVVNSFIDVDSPQIVPLCCPMIR